MHIYWAGHWCKIESQKIVLVTEKKKPRQELAKLKVDTAESLWVIGSRWILTTSRCNVTSKWWFLRVTISKWPNFRHRLSSARGGAAREGKIEGLSFRAGDLLEFIYIFNWKSLSFPVVFYLQKEVFLYYASQIRDVIRGLSKRTPTANHALFLLAMGWKMILSI